MATAGRIRYAPTVQPTLSATVMTYNSLRTLPRCLASLGFCDEVVVADDLSTDGTWEWLQAQSSSSGRIRPFRSRLETFSAQRRFLQSKVRSQWMLVVDADEEVTEALGLEIRAALLASGTLAGYALRLRTYGPDFWSPRPWYDVWQKRLLRTDRVDWPESHSIHAPARIDGSLGRLAAPIAHDSFDSAHHLLKKQLSYAATVAREDHAQGRAGTARRAIVHAGAAFVKYYLLKGLIRFGAGGFFMASSLSLQHFVKYALLWDVSQGAPSFERPVVPGERRDSDSRALRDSAEQPQ